ncbi:MAG: hypothetical protein ACE5KY_00230 [Candidatus Tectimicrobiota bacterium]
MNDEDLLHHLETVAAAVGLALDYVEFAGADWRTSSGLCRVRDDLHLLIDKHLAPRERAAVLYRALKEFDLEGVFCPPLVRQLIEEEGRSIGEPSYRSLRRHAPLAEEDHS